MTYGGGLGAVAAWGFSWGDLAAIVGALVAVVGLAVQVWFHLDRRAREIEFHRKRMSADD